MVAHWYGWHRFYGGTANGVSPPGEVDDLIAEAITSWRLFPAAEKYFAQYISFQ
tara:strand:- start:1890 stop:2051 length:162 start_codon:yes stop_codon:yes gene_type:complete